MIDIALPPALLASHDFFLHAGRAGKSGEVIFRHKIVVTRGALHNYRRVIFVKSFLKGFTDTH